MDHDNVFLLPGELFASREPTLIATLLGSCVAVCLYNTRHHFGGMNHYMLARTGHGESPSTKHGEYSIELLIKMMRQEDTDINHLQAQVVGGGNVTGHLTAGIGIGAQNIVMAKEVLNRHGILVTKSSIGGDHGRKVYFQNWDGSLLLKKIHRSEDSKDIAEKKQAFRERKIKVLVVDDSLTIRNILEAAINTDEGLEVVGKAANPFEARELLLEHDPDVITLDIIMPRMDGVTFLKKLFLYSPKPVIVISTIAQKGSVIRDQVSQIGAVDVMDKEDLKMYTDMANCARILTGKIRMAAATVVKKKTLEELRAI